MASKQRQLPKHFSMVYLGLLLRSLNHVLRNMAGSLYKNHARPRVSHFQPLLTIRAESLRRIRVPENPMRRILSLAVALTTLAVALPAVAQSLPIRIDQAARVMLSARVADHDPAVQVPAVVDDEHLARVQVAHDIVAEHVERGALARIGRDGAGRDRDRSRPRDARRSGRA